MICLFRTSRRGHTLGVAEGELVTQRINLNGARHLAQLVHGGYLRNSAAHAHVTLRVTEKMQQQNDVIFSVTR